MAQTDFFTENTIYNYRLMKRIPHTLYNMAIYIAIVLLLLAKDISEGAWLLFIISYPLALLMHSVMIWIYFYFTVGGAMRGWSFHWGLFWNGVLPEGHASIRLVRSVQQHLLWIGLILIGSLYPWIDYMLWMNLVWFHLWMVLPRFIVFLRFRPFRKNGLIRISHKDTSCYLP
jgi:hypothetical protein